MSDFPERLVYIDDEQDLREIVRQTLEDNGYEGALATCGSGQELLSRLRVLQPELIILDVMMPDMNGVDLIEKLKLTEEGADVPVIFVTGKTRLEMLENYKNLGVIGVIHKPFDFETLQDQIRDMWQAYQGLKNSEDQD